MTLVTKTIVVPAKPATTYETELGWGCDFCGALTDKRGRNIEGATLRHTERSSYPEGGTEKSDIVDCCTACWNSVVIPWLQERGITPRLQEVDW